jgi:thioredoxin 1
MKQTFQQLTQESALPVLVDFYADWCGPCKALSPVVQEVARDMSGRITVIKVDVDRNQQAAALYGIRGVPTLILFYKGRIIWRQSGMMSRHQLTSQLERSLTSMASGA